MAAQSQEKHHYIGPEKLRDKFVGNFDRVKSLTKAIASFSRTTVSVQRKKNGTIEFVIIGGRNGVERALGDVKYEFEKGSSAPIERLSRANKSFLSEGDQKKLQQEGTFCLLTVEALHRHDMLTGATELRQFACLDCNHPWWKHVLRTKPVASCYSCHIRYDALAREKEFGIGRYICHVCEHTFFVWCEATQLQVCYECNTVAGPPFISPRFKSVRSAAVRTGRKQPPPRTILHASTPHVSSGSTNASSVITEDLGSDIFVTLYSVAPQYYLAENFVNTPFYEAFAGGMGGLQLLESPIEVAGPEHFIGEASRLNCLSAQSASQLEGEVSRKRTFAAVASDSNSDGTSQGVQGSGHN